MASESDGGARRGVRELRLFVPFAHDWLCCECGNLFDDAHGRANVSHIFCALPPASMSESFFVSGASEGAPEGLPAPARTCQRGCAGVQHQSWRARRRPDAADAFAATTGPAPAPCAVRANPLQRAPVPRVHGGLRQRRQAVQSLAQKTRGQHSAAQGGSKHIGGGPNMAADWPRLRCLPTT